jgi:PTS system cellobiose-specific IIB component
VKDKTIMLVCSAGMSTTFLMTKMLKAADDQGIVAHVFAVPANQAVAKLATKKIDVLLLGPQVRYMKKEFTKLLADKKVPLAVIDMAAYGMMDGEAVFKQALDLLKSPATQK